MVIACTRCGEKTEGEILNVVVAFTFKHAPGCGQGVGPLVVLRGQIKKPQKIVEDTAEKPVEFSKKEIKVEEKVEKSKSIKEKIKVFGKKE